MATSPLTLYAFVLIPGSLVIAGLYLLSIQPAPRRRHRRAATSFQNGVLINFAASLAASLIGTFCILTFCLK
jgi:hypothetical protein